MPDDKDVETVVAQRVIAMLEARLRDRDKLQIERMQRFIPLVRQLSQEEDELQLVAMLIDDYYQELLHASVHTPEAKSQDQSDKESGGGQPRKRRPKRRRGDSGSNR